jgi:hypothetical protein
VLKKIKKKYFGEKNISERLENCQKLIEKDKQIQD